MLIPDYIVAGDGTLDSPHDLLYDMDPCDPNQPDVLCQVLKPDGQPLTFGEFSQASGTASVKCMDKGTHVVINASGLIPKGVYTVWLLTFAAPGFTPDFVNLNAEVPLGSPDGTQNSFTASAAGEAAISAFHPAGSLTGSNDVSDCLLDEFEFHFVLVYHPDGQTYGPTPGPADALNPLCYFVEQLAFVFSSAL
jgi:hypothetical protein